MNKTIADKSATTDVARADISSLAHRSRARLLDSLRRAPSTPVEQKISATLAYRGPMLLTSLVDRVSEELFRDEVRHGAWAAEIGFMGSAAFRSDVLTALENGAGVLWAIEPVAGRSTE